jgi:beta-barrel assembly-enhancing protease
MSRAGLVAAVLAAGLAAGLSCKASLTPESLGGLYRGIKDARQDLTPENEYFLGRSVGTRILAGADYRYHDRAGWQSGQLSGMTAYVNAVGGVVAFAALETTRAGDRPSPIAGWHFVVIDDDTINAFAAPGGYVFVTSGAIRQARSEDELAAILAHEVAHVVRGHAIGSIKKSRWSSVTKQFLDSTVELDPETERMMTGVFGGSIDDIVDGAMVKGYSKDTELEADRVGLEIMVAAGYDPQAFLRYLKTLDRHQDTGSGGFYATHPRASERLAKLEGHARKHRAVEVPGVRVERFLAATAELR